MIEKSLIIFLPACYPDRESTLRFMLKAGADLFEVGVPFSDPIADGVEIQKAYYEALKSFKLRDIFWIAKEYKKEMEKKLILMSYYNPIYRYGVKRFVEEAYGSGYDALLIVDLPFDEAKEVLEVSKDVGIKNVFLAAPNTNNERLKAIDELSEFIYLVSTYGVTGVRKEVSKLTFEALKKAKSVCKKPIAVGFGISKREHVKEIFNAGADGVVVGSAVVKIVEKFGKSADEMIKKFVEELKSYQTP